VVEAEMMVWWGDGYSHEGKPRTLDVLEEVENAAPIGFALPGVDSAREIDERNWSAG
jgi:hypothetical protein